MNGLNSLLTAICLYASCRILGASSWEAVFVSILLFGAIFLTIVDPRMIARFGKKDNCG